jgi:hypothetical protein
VRISRLLSVKKKIFRLLLYLLKWRPRIHVWPIHWDGGSSTVLLLRPPTGRRYGPEFMHRAYQLVLEISRRCGPPARIPSGWIVPQIRWDTFLFPGDRRGIEAVRSWGVAGPTRSALGCAWWRGEQSPHIAGTESILRIRGNVNVRSAPARCLPGRAQRPPVQFSAARKPHACVPKSLLAFFCITWQAGRWKWKLHAPWSARSWSIVISRRIMVRTADLLNNSLPRLAFPDHHFPFFVCQNSSEGGGTAVLLGAVLLRVYYTFIWIIWRRLGPIRYLEFASIQNNRDRFIEKGPCAHDE